MKDPSSTRLSALVLLVLAVIFGLIFTTYSTYPSVSPSSGSADLSQPREPISRASFAEPSAREYEKRRQVRHRPAPAQDSPKAPPVELPPPITAQQDRNADDHLAAESTSPHADMPSTAAPKPKSVPTIPIIPKPREPSPTPPQPGPRHVRPKLPGDELEDPLRTARSETPPTPTGDQARITPAVVRSTGGTYVVKRGDNLTKIAIKALGTSHRDAVEAVYRANRGRLKSKNRVLVGQRLKIPPWPAAKAGQTRRTSDRTVPERGSSSETPLKLPMSVEARAGSGGSKGAKARMSLAKGSGSAKKPSKKSVRYRWRRVNPRESLSIIAQKELGNGRRWGELWKLNRGRLRRPDRLPAGIRIKIPLAARGDRASMLSGLESGSL